MQVEGAGRYLEEGLEHELQVLEEGQQQKRLHSVRWVQQMKIVGKKRHSPTFECLPQIPLQEHKENNNISMSLN